MTSVPLRKAHDHKLDGSTKGDLEGVVFELKENGVAFNVTKSGNVYIPGGSSNSVTTDANGKTIIRGLDNDKTYTLTETQPLPGYNPLDHDVTLTLHLDSKTVVGESGAETTTYSYDESTATTDDTWGDQVENNTGTTLPSTGGIGTTIFYIAGSILVLGAVIFLVTNGYCRRRRLWISFPSATWRAQEFDCSKCLMIGARCRSA